MPRGGLTLMVQKAQMGCSGGCLVRKLKLSTIIPLVLCLFSRPLFAMAISSEYSDLRPISPPSLQITLTGEIEAGDVARVRAELAKYLDREINDILFLFDSPGGSLIEGLELGKFIASLPVMTSAQVGTFDNPSAICASACVYAFLGADYRYASNERQIGVHRFFGGADQMAGAEAMDISQTISAEITAYLRSRRVDPAFFEDIVSSAPDEINWVSKERLAEVGVLTQGIASELVEYRNLNGGLALYIEQIADVGTSSLFLTCGDKGLVGISSLTQPQLLMIGRTEIVVGEQAFEAVDAQVLKDDGFVVKSAFLVPPEAARTMIQQSSVGVRIVIPSGEMFFGFIGSVKDPKIAETVLNCSSQSLERTTMKRFENLDIAGADLDNQGIRNISLADCEQVCTAIPQCRAVSYIVEKQWCWPKRDGGTVKDSFGIISSIKE